MESGAARVATIESRFTQPHLYARTGGGGVEKCQSDAWQEATGAACRDASLMAAEVQIARHGEQKGNLALLLLMFSL